MRLPLPQASGRGLAEQELLLTCARVDLSSRHQQRLDQLARQSLCWESIGREANAHGITSLLDRHLRPIARQVCPEQVCPESVWRTWHWQSLGVLANNLRLVAELSAIGALLDEAKIPYLCLKGPPLAASCYGDLRLRPSCDLDLLVRPADAEQADCLLMRRGFRPQFRLTGYHWQTFVRTRAELAYRRDEPTVMVELHWSLMSPGYSFTPSVQACWERAEQVNVESFAVRTLGPGDNLLFLCLHAAKHQWQRLIWLVDLAELIRQRSEIDWDRVLTPSIRTKGDRVPKEDEWSVASDAIQGRVVAYVRCGKRITLAGGWWGALTAAAMQWLARLDPARDARLGRCGKLLRTILAPLTMCWLGRAKIVRFLSGTGRPTHRLVLGRQTLATFEDDHQVWKVEWPLRLWIDPSRLSCVGRGRIREGLDEPVPGSLL